MMSCGKPIITTNYSGHTEFCNTENSFLVNIEELEDAYDGKWFNGQGQWGKLDEKQEDELVDFMRYVYNNRININENGIETAKVFSWNNTVDILLNTMRSANLG